MSSERNLRGLEIEICKILEGDCSEEEEEMEDETEMLVEYIENQCENIPVEDIQFLEEIGRSYIFIY